MENQIKAMARKWYLELIMGVLFIAASIWVFKTPISSYGALSLFFAITFLLTGTTKTFYAFSTRKDVEGWGWSFAGGIIEILIGVLLLSKPLFTMAVLPLYVGFALLFRSSLAIGLSVELGRLRIPGLGTIVIFGNPLFRVSLYIALEPRIRRAYCCSLYSDSISGNWHLPDISLIPA